MMTTDRQAMRRLANDARSALSRLYEALCEPEPPERDNPYLMWMGATEAREVHDLLGVTLNERGISDEERGRRFGIYNRLTPRVYGIRPAGEWTGGDGGQA